VTPILAEIAQETEQCTTADLDRLRELLDLDSLPAAEEAGAGLKPLHSPSVSSVPGGTYFNGGRL